MSSISPIFTLVGFAAIAAAVAAGGTVDITHVALGDGAWTPDDTAVALLNETQRVVIAGETSSGSEIKITALADGASEYWVKEIGFYLSDGTLLAVWSHPTQVISYKAAATPLVLALDFLLSGVPEGSINITTSGVPLNLNLTSEFIRLATAQINQNTLFTTLFLELQAQGLAT